MLKFKKVERQCRHNEDIREHGSAASSSLSMGSKIIYDYTILEDGEPKGFFRSEVYKRGYLLYDAAGYEVVNQNGFTVVAPSKGFFDAVFEASRPLIPTPEQIAERERKKLEDEAEEERKKAEDHKLWLKKEAAGEMYDALKRLLDFVFDKGWRPQHENSALIQAHNAIAKADGKIEGGGENVSAG